MVSSASATTARTVTAVAASTSTSAPQGALAVAANARLTAAPKSNSRISAPSVLKARTRICPGKPAASLAPRERTIRSCERHPYPSVCRAQLASALRKRVRRAVRRSRASTPSTASVRSAPSVHATRTCGPRRGPRAFLVEPDVTARSAAQVARSAFQGTRSRWIGQRSVRRAVLAGLLHRAAPVSARRLLPEVSPRLALPSRILRARREVSQLAAQVAVRPVIAATPRTGAETKLSAGLAILDTSLPVQELLSARNVTTEASPTCLLRLLVVCAHLDTTSTNPAALLAKRRSRDTSRTAKE